MGPLLPLLARQWALTDARSGLLLGLLLTGSCGGTLTLQHRLERGVRRGVLCAAAGVITLALCTLSYSAYLVAIGAVTLMGFGLGSLMSAVNLLAGGLPPQRRTSTLARLGAVWCAGAMLSPAFAGWRLLGMPLWIRLMFLAVLFLACLLRPEAWQGSDGESQVVVDKLAGQGSKRSVTLACAAAMFLYGGAEACISGWLPTFANRYGEPTLGAAPWVTSALWLGLIVSRAAIPRGLTPASRERMLKAALPGTALTLILMIVAPRTAGIAIGFLLGVLIGPGFPLVLSGTLDWRLGTRAMGVVLAAAALGGAVFPPVLGQISMFIGLRSAFIVPVIILASVPWLPRRAKSTSVRLSTRVPISA